jgi:hypothetical protein
VDILSIVIAVLAALAALLSLWLARLTRRESMLDRRLDRLLQANQGVTEVRWAAHAPPYNVVQPLHELRSLLALVPEHDLIANELVGMPFRLDGTEEDRAVDAHRIEVCADRAEEALRARIGELAAQLPMTRPSGLVDRLLLGSGRSS